MAKGSGGGVRFLCLAITFISLVLSIFIGFSTYSEEKATEKYKKGITYNTAKQNEIATSQTTLEKETEILLAEKSKIENKIAAAKKLVYYETHPVCFLTFDDGPTSNTLRILDILQTQHVKGTFFVSGYLLDTSSGETALQRITSEGHALGMRANDSSYSVFYAGKDAFLDDIMTLRATLEEKTGITSNLVRMPGGTATAYSCFGKYGGNSEDYYAVLEELDYQGIAVCDWNVETKDYSASTGVNTVINNALTGAANRLAGNHKYKAVILLMHDSNATVSALPDIIKGLADLGFSFEVLSADGYIYRQK